ncbi:MAG: hypothetical protein NTW86_29020 [Candidatus Sumerlaeota bacterium]|nr:hypothetical protein [Candidatus Sumerlaeota bacterium]
MIDGGRRGRPSLRLSHLIAQPGTMSAAASIPSPDSASPTRRAWPRVFVFLAAVYALACVPLLWIGYGADHDAWLVATSALNLASGQGYTPSRLPGYPLLEFLCSVLIPWGGCAASNAAALIATAFAALVFWRVLNLRDEPARGSALAFFALQPYVLKNAFTTMDYNFALLFVLVAYWAMLKKRHVFAGIEVGVAAGFRSTSALFALPLVWLIWRERRGWKAFLLFCLSTGLTGLIAYSPLLLKYGVQFLFFRISDFASTKWHCLAGAYHGVSYLGPLATAAVVAALFASLASPERRRAWRAQLGDVPFVALCLYGLLFAVLPDESDYLVIAAPFLALWLPRVVGRRWWIAIVALTILHGIATIDLVGGESGERRLGVRPTLGVLPSDALMRLRYERLSERLPRVGVAQQPTVVLSGNSAIEIDNPRVEPARVRVGAGEIDLFRFTGTNVYVTFRLFLDDVKALQANGWRVGYLDITRGNAINSYGYDPAKEGCFEINAQELSGLPNWPIKKR